MPYEVQQFASLSSPVPNVPGVSPVCAICALLFMLLLLQVPGEARLKVAPSWPWSISARRWSFSLQKGTSASSTSVSPVPFCGGSFYPVSSSLLGVIFPRVVVYLLCPQEEVCSESAYVTILTPLSCLKSWKFTSRHEINSSLLLFYFRLKNFHIETKFRGGFCRFLIHTMNSILTRSLQGELRHRWGKSCMLISHGCCNKWPQTW